VARRQNDDYENMVKCGLKPRGRPNNSR